MAARILPTPEQLRELLRYEPDTGKLFWLPRPREMFTKDRLHLSWNSRHAGKEAFTASNRGYKVGRVFDLIHQGHRIAWAVHFGEWPAGLIDHIDGNRSDNRICNLREATQSENGMNRGATRANSSGLKGAAWSEKYGKWESRIKAAGKAKFLGYFDTAEEAHGAYVKAVSTHHGEFARTE